MGWKSTVILTRQEAIDAINKALAKPFDELSDKELEDMAGGLLGDNPDLPYYGCNFIVGKEDE